MPSFDAHLSQAKSNLTFLEHVNHTLPEQRDWQVTVCFYVAVHLANAYLADKEHQHYQTHGKRDLALNPFNGAAQHSWPEDEYYAYEDLSALSRRSRYLCSEADNRGDRNVRNQAFLTHEKHLLEALRNLDLVMTHFENVYNQDLPILEMTCAGLDKASLSHFLPRA